MHNRTVHRDHDDRSHPLNVLVILTHLLPGAGVSMDDIRSGYSSSGRKLSFNTQAMGPYFAEGSGG